MGHFDEKARVVAKEETVLEKFEGDVDAGVLVERLYIENGVIIKVETFEDGVLTNTVVDGGK